jgi:hypothetical protein
VGFLKKTNSQWEKLLFPLKTFAAQISKRRKNYENKKNKN